MAVMFSYKSFEHINRRESIENISKGINRSCGSIYCLRGILRIINGRKRRMGICSSFSKKRLKVLKI